MKKCKDCGENKLFDDYYTQEKVKANGQNYIYCPPYCKQCTIMRASKWTEGHEEISKDKKAEWYQQNKERLLEKQKLLDNKNKEQKEIYGQQYRKSEHGKEKYHGYGLKRRVKNHIISKEEWIECKQYFNYCCAYCGLHIKDHKKKYAGVLKQIDFNKEHVDDEGANDLSNCVPSCHSCNSKKRTKDINEWYNENNTNYTYERLNKIIKWLEFDYKLYMS